MANPRNPFFGADVDPRDVQVTAVAKDGSAATQADAEKRNTSTVLAKWLAKVGRNLVLGMVMGSTLLTAMPSLAASAPADSAFVKNNVVATATYFGYSGMRAELLGSSTASLKENLQFHVVSGDNDVFENSSPISYAGFNKDDVPGCYISMAGVDSFSELATNINEETRLDLNDFVAVHENMHCEQFAVKIDKDSQPANHVNTYVRGLDYVSKLDREIEGADIGIAGTSNVRILYGERSADGGAQLRVAAKIFKDANTFDKLNIAIQRFDKFTDALISVRIRENKAVDHQLQKLFSSGDVSDDVNYVSYFNDHESVNVLHSIKNMVHSAAKDPVSMAEFVKTELTPEKTMETSSILALGSIRADHNQLLSRQAGFAEKYLKISTARVDSKIQEINAQLNAFREEIKSEEALTASSVALSKRPIELTPLVSHVSKSKLAEMENSVSFLREQYQSNIEVLNLIKTTSFDSIRPNESELDKDTQIILHRADKSYADAMSISHQKDVRSDAAKDVAGTQMQSSGLSNSVLSLISRIKESSAANEKESQMQFRGERMGG